eukprot:g2858.t1
MSGVGAGAANAAAPASAFSSSGALQPRHNNPSVSDLLLGQGLAKGKEGKTTQADWYAAVRREMGENFDEKCQTRLQSAQVNCWQVLATRAVGSAADGKRPRLPGDVLGLVCSFIGPIHVPEPLPDRWKIAAAVKDARARDTLRAVKYYVSLIEEEAKKGAHEFRITKEIFEGAPLSSLGTPIHIAYVCQYLFQELKYDPIHVGPEPAEEDEAEPHNFGDMGAIPGGTSSEAYLPVRVKLAESVDEITRSEDPDVHDGHLEEICDRAQELEDAFSRKGATTFAETTCGATTPTGLNPFQKAYADTIRAGVHAAASYVLDLAMESFKAGNCSFLLTEEIWQNAPKLPNGALPPFFFDEVDDLCRSASGGVNHYYIGFAYYEIAAKSSLLLKPRVDEGLKYRFPVKISMVI